MQRRLHSSMTLEGKPNGYGTSFQAHMPAEGKDNLLTDNLKMTFPRVSHAYILLQIWPNSSEPRAEMWQNSQEVKSSGRCFWDPFAWHQASDHWGNVWVFSNVPPGFCCSDRSLCVFSSRQNCKMNPWIEGCISISRNWNSCRERTAYVGGVKSRSLQLSCKGTNILVKNYNFLVKDKMYPSRIWHAAGRIPTAWSPFRLNYMDRFESGKSKLTEIDERSEKNSTHDFLTLSVTVKYIFSV